MLKPRLRLTALLGVLLLFVVCLDAQEAPRSDAPKPAGTNPKLEGLPFWDTSHGIKVAASMQLFGAPSPLALPMIRVTGSEQPLLWPEWQLVVDRAPPLSRKLLARLKDGTEVPDFSGKAPVPKAGWNLYWALTQALLLAAQTPNEAFAKSAQGNEHVTFTHLWQTPDKFRGKVIPIKGRLLRVRKMEALQRVKNEGTPFVYEAWIAGPTKHTNPFAVLFTELPEGFQPAEEMDRPVTFYGYFIVKVRYTAAKDVRQTPLLVGHSLVLGPASPTAPAGDQSYGPFSRSVLYAVIGGLIVLTLLFFFFNLWFRRGDAQVQARLAEVRDRQTTLPGQESGAGPFVDEHTEGSTAPTHQPPANGPPPVG